MRNLYTAIAAGLAAMAPALFAQWPDHKAPGAPRTPAGSVDLTASAPKTADGRPNFSGVWDRGRPIGSIPAGPAGAGNFGAPPAPGPRPFQDLPSMFPDGLPLQPWAAELRRQRLAENSKDHPDAHCLPLHPVQLHTHPQPRKIIQTPGLVLIVYEANQGLRQIFTAGRPLPSGDLEPWWYGYSTGKWDGDTLVVDTTGFHDYMWLDEEGTPGTSALRLTERFRRPDYGTLEVEISVNDPKAFTKPWTVKFSQRLMPDTELIEFICAENNRSVTHLVGK